MSVGAWQEELETAMQDCLHGVSNPNLTDLSWLKYSHSKLVSAIINVGKYVIKSLTEMNKLDRKHLTRYHEEECVSEIRRFKS